MILLSLIGVGVRAIWGSGSVGILSVNMAGSLIAGFLGGLKLSDNPWVTAGIVGFCGCLTTFSGFALDNVKLLEQGEIFKVGANFFLNNAMCLSLCYGGWLLSQKI